MDKIPHVRTGTDTSLSSWYSKSVTKNMARIIITDLDIVDMIGSSGLTDACVCLSEKLQQHISNKCNLTTIFRSGL